MRVDTVTLLTLNIWNTCKYEPEFQESRSISTVYYCHWNKTYLYSWIAACGIFSELDVFLNPCQLKLLCSFSYELHTLPCPVFSCVNKWHPDTVYDFFNNSAKFTVIYIIYIMPFIISRWLWSLLSSRRISCCGGVCYRIPHYRWLKWQKKQRDFSIHWHEY